MPEVLPGLSRRQLLATSLMAGASTFLTGSNFALAAHRTDPGWQAGNKSLAISVRQDGSFDLFVDNIFWLSSAAPALHLNGAWYHAAGTLTRVSCDRGFSRDKLGPYSWYTILWQVGDIPFETSYRLYTDSGCIVFSQTFPDGAQNISLPETDESKSDVLDGVDCAVNESGVISAFPLIKPASLKSDISYLSYKGSMANPKRGSNLDSFAGGTEAGVPLVLFDQQLRTTVISPLNHFANAVQVKSDQLAGHLACGLSGRIDRLPPAFSQETIIFAGQGVNQTLFDWGSQLLKQGGKSRLAKSSDKTANYLGYCTDNGAYYYYNTEGGKTYEETIVDISHSLKQEGYPAQYLQLDSWWYEKGRDQGTSLWEPRADIFVHSLADLHAETRLPFAAHNRYWSASNKYNTAYRFIVENAAAVPDDPDFWRHIMSWSRQNGICMYEQDWLNVIYERSPALQSDPLLSERWLGQMDQAASQAGLHIMYCMALPSHYLASTLYPSVSRVRATNDYCPGNDQWKMGLSSMLSWALGLAPFKDVFWSSEKQASNPYKNATVTEPNFELQALVSALSGGGVATGDKIGSLNKTLVAKTCRTDGLLLKADKPATPIDRCFQPDAPTGEIWGTQTSIGGLTWRFLLVADQTASYTLKASDLSTHSPYMVLETESGQLSLLTENDCLSVGGTTPPRPGAVPLQYFVFAPVGKKGLTFLGEVDKFITVSRQRFTAISPDGGHLKLTGAPNEEVNLAWHCRGKSRRISYNDRIVKADDALVKVHRQDQLLHLSVRLDQSGQGSVEISI